MTPYELTRALRRDDLTLRRGQVDLVLTVEHAREPLHDASVVLVDRTDEDEPSYDQALEELADYSNEYGPVFVYVPLMFGPVQEAAR